MQEWQGVCLCVGLMPLAIALGLWLGYWYEERQYKRKQDRRV